MARDKAPTGYSRAQITLHWVIALLIVAQFVLHDPIVAAWKAKTEGLDPEFNILIAAHVFGGV